MKTKKEWKYFNIFQYEKEQEYLNDMHKKGWKLTKVNGLGTYHFEECEPEDVVYQLDYNKEGRANKEEYVAMFADCGWEYLFDFADYSYFRKSKAEMNNEESIFSDEQSRYEMMERVCKGRLLPVLVLFCAGIVPQFIFNITIYHNYFLSVLYGIIFILYITIFVASWKKMLEFKKTLDL